MVITQRSLGMNSISSSRSDISTFMLLPAVLLLAAAILLFGWTGLCLGESLKDLDRFPALKARLIADGFDAALVESLYANPEIAFDRKVISVYFLYREGKLNYDQFLARSAIDETVAYYKKHEKTLKRVEDAYGVNAEVICAIILVETRLGKVVGSRLVINTLSTLADLDEKRTRDRLWLGHLRDKTDDSERQFEVWAARKSAWAYDELKAYLEYVSAQEMDPRTIQGSFAGAMGIAQFIPSSILQYARDGNKDGRINLFQHEDAIESIANYLKQNGWKPGLSRQEAFDVILKYNNSRYYAETILKVAELVEESRKKMGASWTGEPDRLPSDPRGFKVSKNFLLSAPLLWKKAFPPSA